MRFKNNLQINKNNLVITFLSMFGGIFIFIIFTLWCYLAIMHNIPDYIRGEIGKYLILFYLLIGMLLCIALLLMYLVLSGMIQTFINTSSIEVNDTKKKLQVPVSSNLDELKYDVETNKSELKNIKSISNPNTLNISRLSKRFLFVFYLLVITWILIICTQKFRISKN